MFSFLKKNKEEESTQSTTPSTSQKPHRDQQTTPHTAQSDTATGSSTTSSFSFIQVPDPSAESAAAAAAPHPPPPTSSFSFMQGGGNDSTDASSATVPFTPSSGSSFGFMSSSATADQTHAAATPDILTQPVAAAPPQEIKLAKVASNKVVKKKKRVSRVGAGRDDDGGDNTSEDAPSTAVQQSNSSRVSAMDAIMEDEPVAAHVSVHSGMEAADTTSVVPSDVVTGHGHDVPPPPPESPALPPRPMYRPASPPVTPDMTTNNVMQTDDNNAPSPENRPAQTITSDDTPFDRAYPDAGADSNSVANEQRFPVSPATCPLQDPGSTASVTVSKETDEDYLIPVAVQPGSLEALEQLLNSYAAIQHDSIERTKQLTAAIELDNSLCADLINKIAQTESDQAKFAALEEFEKAEGMNLVLDSLRLDLAECEKRITARSADVKSIQAGLESARARSIEQFANTIDILKSSGSSQNEEIVGRLQSLTARQVAMETEWRAELERIEAERAVIDKDEKIINEELETVEEGITSQTAEHIAEKQSLEAATFSVEHEIEELTRLLDSKKEERARLQTELEEVDVKIHNVRKKYERQLRRGNDRRAEHVLMRSEIQEDENRALRSKQEKETDISSQMGFLVRSQQIASTIITDVEIAQLFVGHISSEALSTANDSLLVVLSCSGSDLARRSRSSSSSDANSLAAAQTAWSNAQQEHGLLEAELQDLETEARALSERLPKLEAEKKSHAAGKRFKEAAAAASAMKEATARISSIEIDTATLLERLTASAEAVNKCAENVQVALEEQRQENRRLETNRLRLLASRAAKLRTLGGKVKRLQIDAKEKAVATLADIVGENIATTAAQNFLPDKFADGVLMLIQHELTAIVEEGRQISVRYSENGDDSMANECDLGGDVIAAAVAAVSPSDASLSIPVAVVNVDTDSSATFGDVLADDDDEEEKEDDDKEVEEPILFRRPSINVEELGAPSSGETNTKTDCSEIGTGEESVSPSPVETVGTAIDTDSCINQSEATSGAVGEQTSSSAAADAAHEAMIARAANYIASVNELEEKMTQAADEDDFELAGSFQAQLEDIQAELDELKASLAMTNEEILAHI